VLGPSTGVETTLLRIPVFMPKTARIPFQFAIGLDKFFLSLGVSKTVLPPKFSYFQVAVSFLHLPSLPRLLWNLVGTDKFSSQCFTILCPFSFFGPFPKTSRGPREAPRQDVPSLFLPTPMGTEPLPFVPPEKFLRGTVTYPSILSNMLISPLGFGGCYMFFWKRSWAPTSFIPMGCPATSCPFISAVSRLQLVFLEKTSRPVPWRRRWFPLPLMKY